MSASVKGFGCRPVRDGSDAAVGPAFESLQRRKPRYDEAPAPGKRDNPLPLLPELLDPKSHHIAGLQKTRRFHAHADPRRGAGRDDIAGQKRHALAQIAHERRQSKIIVRVLPLCMRSPFTSSHMSRSCTSPTSSLVTRYGPTGPKVSKLLPLSHCPPRSS